MYNELYSNEQPIEHVFGIDRLICSMPIYDEDTGEMLVDTKELMNRLKSLSSIHTKRRETRMSQMFDPVESSAENEFSLDNDEEWSSEKIVGSLDSLPIKVTLKQDRLTLDITLSKIVHGHNAFPTSIDQIEPLCAKIAEIINIDIMNMQLKVVEYTFGIKTNQTISSIVDSLGSLGKGERHTSNNGMRWTDIGHGSSIQLYSTNKKNKKDHTLKLNERCAELKEMEQHGYDMIRLENRRMYGYRNSTYTTLNTVADITKPAFILEELDILRRLFSKVVKNSPRLNIELLQRINVFSLIESIEKPSDFKDILAAIGWGFLLDITLNWLPRTSVRNKDRFRKLFDECEETLQRILGGHTWTEHFKDKALNVIEHYIKHFNRLLDAKAEHATQRNQLA